MAGYRSRFEALLDELHGTAGIEVEEGEIAPPADDAALATARVAALYGLPDGLADLYSETNGFTLAWSSAAPGESGEPDRGSVQLLPIERIFASWQGTTWWDDFPGGDRFRDVKPFDLFASEACGAFLQDDQRPPGAEVVLHVFGEGTSRMGLTFPQYVEGLLAARGFLYWQQALIDPTDDAAHRFRTRMPELFPDFDADAFVAATRTPGAPPA